MDKTLKFGNISKHNGPEESSGYLLWRVSTSWRNSIEAVLKPLQLTHPQFVILATLGWLTWEGDRVTQAAVAKLAGLDPNTTSQIMGGLEKKGLIKRVISIDPRSKNPLLTEDGRKTLAKAMPAVEKADVTFFSTLTAHESKSLLSSFAKLMTP